MNINILASFISFGLYALCLLYSIKLYLMILYIIFVK